MRPFCTAFAAQVEDICGDHEDGYGDVFGAKDADGGGAPLPRRNYMIIEALLGGGLADDEPDKSEPNWTTPDLDRHDFALAPGGDAAAWAPGATVDIRVLVAVDADDDSEAEEEDDEPKSDTFEGVVQAALVEQGGPDNGFWRCYLLDTPADLDNKAPHLMLLKGRELVVPLVPENPPVDA